MEKLKQYLESSVKGYSAGVELLEKHGGKSEEIQFFKSSKDDKMKFNMLLRRLQNIYRIAAQNPVKTEQEPEIKTKGKPIAVKQIHFSEFQKLVKTKLLTNKLLARNWKELDQKEREYFNNNSQLFEYKKGLMIENSQIESELKTLHAQLQTAPSDDERQTISQKLVDLKNKQTKNWEKIDDFIEKSAKNTSSAEMVQKRNNLRAQISKLTKKLKGSEPGTDVYIKKEEALKAAKLELEEIEKLI